MVNALKEVLAIIDRIFNPKKENETDKLLAEELYKEISILSNVLRKIHDFVEQRDLESLEKYSQLELKTLLLSFKKFEDSFKFEVKSSIELYVNAAKLYIQERYKGNKGNCGNTLG
jgi:hypothetical protein